MLLIAVTGPPGAGKTTLLATLVEWSRAQGLPADGFLARAGGRGNPHVGADRYDLEWVADGRVVPFAQRTPTGIPSYAFNEIALADVRAWARELHTRPASPLVVLDEFGQLEAGGGGHLGAWPDLAAADPEVVVAAVRAGLVEEISTRLGRDFDVIIDAENPDAWETLRAACREHRDWLRIGGWGAGAGGVEVGLGSALHGIKVPGRGLVLSSLQTAVMVAAGAGMGRRQRVVWVPFIAAGLKAVSPAGNRLRPMLAITIQGLLFGGATTALGWNLLGVALGGWLVGVWAGAQGAVLQYLLVGDQLLRAYDSVTGWLTARWDVSAPGIWTAIAVWIIAWGLVTMSTGLYVYRRRTLPRRFRELMARRMEGLGNGEPVTRRRAALLGLRDLARPVFWTPLLIIAAIVLAAGAPWGDVFWMAARAVTVGFVVFSLARGFDPRRVVAWLRRRGQWGPAVALEKALRRHTGDRRR
ncbi:DUF2478 domain-containing protein [bacterium]|nr:DUF2478 domain-containing protein [bacterium]MBU1072017.1 DUF2478 domain-containing protein [bacterium]MBU1676250.1 DUF2478 domain-containing protein [bacterium]